MHKQNRANRNSQIAPAYQMDPAMQFPLLPCGGDQFSQMIPQMMPQMYDPSMRKINVIIGTTNFDLFIDYMNEQMINLHSKELSEAFKDMDNVYRATLEWTDAKAVPGIVKILFDRFAEVLKNLLLTLHNQENPANDDIAKYTNIEQKIKEVALAWRSGMFKPANINVKNAIFKNNAFINDTEVQKVNAYDNIKAEMKQNQELLESRLVESENKQIHASKQQIDYMYKLVSNKQTQMEQQQIEFEQKLREYQKQLRLMSDEQINKLGVDDKESKYQNPNIATTNVDTASDDGSDDTNPSPKTIIKKFNNAQQS